MTRGTVSPDGRSQGAYNDPRHVDRFAFRDAIRSTALSGPGSSGGPVATRDGRVIGIVSGGNGRTSIVVRAQQIRIALRMAERANGRPIGAWPPLVGPHRIAVPGQRDGEWRYVPANARATSEVTEHTGPDRSRFVETRTDGRTSESELRHDAIRATHRPTNPLLR